MKLSEIKSSFEKGLISKHDFIDKMYKSHESLFEYTGLLYGDGISRIEISNESVVMAMKPTIGEGEIKLHCVTNDKRTTTLEILNFGAYEKADSTMLFRLTEPGFTVFDIGANIGWYTLNLSKIVSSGLVYSFEPIPETYSNLKKNIHINNVSNVQIYNVALSDVNGETEFFYSPDELGAASAKNIKGLEEIKKTKCQTKTLDSFSEEKKITGLDLIKCDVEGGELFVFEGGMKAINKFKPVVFTEMLRKWSAKFNYHPNKIISLFSDAGYRCFIIAGEKIKEIQEINENTVETNFIFLHPEKHLNKINKYT